MDEARLNELLIDIPYGSLTVEIHRAYGATQQVKMRRKCSNKTTTIQESLDTIGAALVETLTTSTTGHLLAEITFNKGRLQYTNIEQALD